MFFVMFNDFEMFNVGEIYIVADIVVHTNRFYFESRNMQSGERNL